MGKPVVSIKGSEAAEAIVRIAQRLKRKISGVGG